MNQERCENEHQMRWLDTQEMAQVEGGTKPVVDKGQGFNGCIPLLQFNKFGPYNSSNLSRPQ